MTQTCAVSVVIAVIVGTAASLAFAQQLQLRITAPADDVKVVYRAIIEGIVSDPAATVWVVIHPMEVSDYWVQPAVTVGENGRWRVQVYIGRPLSGDIGKRFEVRAFANSKASLKEGDVLRTWPDAQSKSQVVEVVRK
jgi:hypothetical protein